MANNSRRVPNRYRVQQGAQGYAVVDPEGKRVGDVTPFRLQAEREMRVLQAAADRKAGRRERACLCCGSVFASTGPGNRLCGTCRHRDAEAMPCSIVRPTRRSA